MQRATTRPDLPIRSGTRSGRTKDLMLLTMMKGKLHRAAVTQCDLHDEGSCSIDIDLLDAANILPHERVDIWNITNGARISSYAIEAPRGSRTIGINGAAARYFQTGDRVIIAAFAQVNETEAKQWAPSVVRLNDRNEVVTGIA
jgi:aspartate 1-decarboxylase